MKPPIIIIIIVIWHKREIAGGFADHTQTHETWKGRCRLECCGQSALISPETLVQVTALSSLGNWRGSLVTSTCVWSIKVSPVVGRATASWIERELEAE